VPKTNQKEMIVIKYSGSSDILILISNK